MDNSIGMTSRLTSDGFQRFFGLLSRLSIALVWATSFYLIGSSGMIHFNDDTVLAVLILFLFVFIASDIASSVEVEDDG